MKHLIGYLMFLANGEGVKEPWYTLKGKLCRRFGVNNGYDVQYLEGKECHYCDGTGWFKSYSLNRPRKEPCYRCQGGWYKLPRYVLLERIKVGRYVFHKPIRSEYKPIKLTDSDVPVSVAIEGYIWHSRKKFGWLAFGVLFLLFARKEYRQYVGGMGWGWRSSWWLPMNYLRNFMHLKKNGRNAIPIVRLRERMKRYFNKARKYTPADELPF